jgi:hypothetical protein
MDPVVFIASFAGMVCVGLFLLALSMAYFLRLMDYDVYDE